jgi:2-haloacid dehalogenase
VRVAWAFFDLNGTLLDPSGIGEPLGLGPEQSAAALDDAVTASMAETLSGGYRPMPELIGAALRRRAEVAGRPLERLEEALERAAHMPPYPEAGEALSALRTRGVRPGVLTNSPAAGARKALEAAGLEVDLAVGSDEVEAFKPDPRLYRRGLEAAGARPSEACLVAAHWWDLLGAARAGLRTAWVARKERALFATFDPDVSGRDLRAAVEGLEAG